MILVTQKLAIEITLTALLQLSVGSHICGFPYLNKTQTNDAKL